MTPDTRHAAPGPRAPAQNANFPSVWIIFGGNNRKPIFAEIITRWRVKRYIYILRSAPSLSFVIKLGSCWAGQSRERTVVNQFPNKIIKVQATRPGVEPPPSPRHARHPATDPTLAKQRGNEWDEQHPVSISSVSSVQSRRRSLLGTGGFKNLSIYANQPAAMSYVLITS